MASKIVTGDEANELGHKEMREATLLFSVLVDVDTMRLVFLGTEALIAAFKDGVELEKYIVEKLGQARAALVKGD